MKRKLTATFKRAIGSVNQTAPEIEVVLMATQSKSSGLSDVTFLPAPDRRTIKLTQPQMVVEFEVTPSQDPTFSTPILYRIAWRRGYLGKMESFEFYMPNHDTSLEDLITLGNLEKGEVLTVNDLGKPGGAAQLSPDGHVLDGSGTQLYSRADIDLKIEESDALRAQEDAGIVTLLGTTIEGLEEDLGRSLGKKVTDSEERTTQALQAQKTLLQSADEALRTELLQRITDSSTDVPEDLISLLNSKADLVEGKVKLEQLPDNFGQGKLIQVANNERLTQTPADTGDFVVSPTDAFYLNGTDYTNSNHWVRISTLQTGVQRVNNKTGSNIVLTPEDIGARPVGPIPLTDINGFELRLSERLQGSVFLSEDNKIDTGLLRGDVPRLDGNTLTTSTGEVIPLAGDVTSVNGEVGDVTITPSSINARSTDVPITISEVTNLQTSLNSKANTTDSRFTDSRTPKSHADSHTLTGSDPLTIAIEQVNTLPSELSGKATKLEFQQFRDEIYADLPDNPEQQAEASRQYAAISLTAAENSADRQEQSLIYVNELNNKFTEFIEQTSNYSEYYTVIQSVGTQVNQAKSSIDTSRSAVENLSVGVSQVASVVNSERALAEEAAALSVLVSEMLGFTINGGDITVPRPLVGIDTVGEEHLTPELRDKIIASSSINFYEVEPGTGLYRLGTPPVTE